MKIQSRLESSLSIKAVYVPNHDYMEVVGSLQPRRIQISSDHVQMLGEKYSSLFATYCDIDIDLFPGKETTEILESLWR